MFFQDFGHKKYILDKKIKFKKMEKGKRKNEWNNNI